MKKLLLLIVMAVALTGCKKDPISCFTHTGGDLNDVNSEIEFTASCVFHTTLMEWDWGDGNSAVGYSRAHAWEAPGVYTVSLTASDQGNNPDVATETIVIGDRYLQYLDIRSLPADNNGTPWDPSDEPDVVIALRKSGSASWEVETPENTNMTKSAPYLEDLQSLDVIFMNETWEYEVRDMDGGSYEVMASGTFNPYTDGSNFVIPQTNSAAGIDMDVRYWLQDPQ